MKRSINVGLIGFGIVGSGAVSILKSEAEHISKKVGCPVNIVKICDLDITTDRGVDVDKSILTTSANDVLENKDIDIVVETIGGTEPAGAFIRKALQNGKNVVTANKELIAKKGADLLSLAKEKSLDLLFEASVGGGIPVIRPMKVCLSGNQVSEVCGIVNGTTNYILTRMANEGLSYETVLPDAQAKGYAEADPTADVEGYDAAYKISILSSIAFTSRVDVAKVSREGITKITAEDIKYANELGYVIKLIAIGKLIDDKMQVRVHPAFLSKTHPLANVNDVMNAVFIKASAVGEVMFYGPGAGSLAAGSAVVGDVVDIAYNIVHNSCGRISCTCFDHREMVGKESVVCKNYIRIITEDKPRVLSSVTTVFADNNVSIKNVMQKILPCGSAEIVWLTHEAKETDVEKALCEIKSLPVVKGIASCIKVQE